MSILLNASTSTGLGITSDNSGSIEVQSNGTTKLTVASTGVYGTITAATAQATTSGTSIDFTGIPSWARKITVLLNEISTNGTNHILIQIGSGSVETTGYSSVGSALPNSATVSSVSSTAGFLVFTTAASNVVSGHVMLTLVSGNIWIGSVNGKVNATSTINGGGAKTTSGALDRVRLTTVGGTDTFDAGSINIFYEG
jgi:hypothetical protein